MTANELRRIYVKFFEERGHKEISSASLLPENDPGIFRRNMRWTTCR